MAWIGVELEGTLVEEDEAGNMLPTEGAVETMTALVSEGHRITVLTSKFAPMPDTLKRQMKQKLEEGLMSVGFPQEMEVWAGSTKPNTDLDIGNKSVTYDNDWGLVLAQLQVMLEDRGLVPLMPDDGMIEPGMDGAPPPAEVGEEPAIQPQPKEKKPEPSKKSEPPKKAGPSKEKKDGR